MCKNNGTPTFLEGRYMAKPKHPAEMRLPADAPLVERAKAMSDFELALLVATNTFQQWIARCGSAAGMVGLSTLDILVLHFLCNRNRAMRAVDVAFALSIDDVHLVSYALKKLVRQQLVTKERHGNEILHSASKAAISGYERYQSIRRQCLIKALEMLHNPEQDLPRLTGMLRALAGIYEQAARTAATAT